MKKANGLFILMDLLLIVIFIEAVFPPVTLIVNPMVVTLLCLIAWCALSFLRDPYFYLNFEKNIRILYPMLFLVISIVVPYIFDNGIIGNRYASLALLPMGYIIFNYYDKHGKLNRLKRVVYVAIAFASVTFVRTLIALIENPNICRTIKSEGAYTEGLYRQGIAGYSFVYFIALCSIVVLNIAIKEYKTKTTLPLLGLYVLMAYFVLKSNYVTALLIVALGAAILLVAEFINRKKIGVVLFLFIAGIFVVSYQNEIINTLSFLIPERIADVIVVGDGSIFKSFVDEFMYDRFPVMKSSIDAYVENPVGGLVINEKINTSGGFLEGFGQHSHIVDTFALYGTTIGILNLFVITRPFRNNRGRFVSNNVPLTVAMMVAIFVVLLFNNTTDAIALAFTIIYPLARDYNRTRNLPYMAKERQVK